MIRGGGWLWWLTDRSPVDEWRVRRGEPVALIGEPGDALDDWARAVDPHRPLLDLTDKRPVPSVGHVRRAFGGATPIVIGNRPERVLRCLGMEAQPYYVSAAPLASRPTDAMPLLEMVLAELATTQPLRMADLGDDAAGLAAYPWRGLGEIRTTARYLAALIEEGNITRAAIRLGVTRQCLSRYLGRRMYGGPDHGTPRSAAR